MVGGFISRSSLSRDGIWPIFMLGAFSGAIITYLGMRSYTHEPPKKTFILFVDVIFNSIEDRDKVIQLWQPVALHCRVHEPGTLSYEMAISDSDPKRIVFVERYTDKEHSYLEIHKSSEAFLHFREQLANFQPTITGHSYISTDIGYFDKL